MNVLTKIVEDKKEELKIRKTSLPLDSFVSKIKPNDRDFKQALQVKQRNAKSAFILEVKKASPSKGLIRADFDLDEICSAYRDYATCISVLTDEKYFQGDFSRIESVKALLPQPILCKDFFIDDYQVYLARFKGANAILLMLSVLDDAQYIQLRNTAKQLNLSVLTEVSNVEEMQRAIELKADILGINNRNLRDLSTDLSQTEYLVNYFTSHASQEQQNDTVLISESGIYHHQQVQMLSQHAHGFLVGSSLMAEKDISAACRDLVLGEHKVCGMKDAKIAQHALNNGAKYIGLIRVEQSPRYVSKEQAQELSSDLNGHIVLVTRDMPIEQLIAEIECMKPIAVQLHGAESADYIIELKALLTKKRLPTEIWRAIAVNDQLPSHWPEVDRIVLDTQSIDGQSGGTGKAFNWEVLDKLTLNDPKIMLAGGINRDNVPTAIKQNVIGLDINSGVETEKGIKDPAKVETVFTRLKELTI